MSPERTTASWLALSKGTVLSVTANSLASTAERQRRGRARTRSLLSGMCSSTQTNLPHRLYHTPAGQHLLFGTRLTWIISRWFNTDTVGSKRPVYHASLYLIGP